MLVAMYLQWSVRVNPHVWKTLYYHLCLQSQAKAERGGRGQALCQLLNKRERIGTTLQHQRIQPRKHTVIITMRGVAWLILSDWPQVPVSSQHRSSQGERERSVLFQPLHQRMGGHHHLNTITGKLVERCHALQQLHAALIAVALQSSHSTNDCFHTDRAPRRRGAVLLLELVLVFFF